MNILYISNLSTNIAAGLNWSVPASIHAQSLIDDVYWLNLSNVKMDHWIETGVFHNISEFCKFRDFTLEILPSPFNNPDLVVFEGFYHIKDAIISRKLYKSKIPYIIVPRSAMTKVAQEGGYVKRLKKLLANYLIFNQYSRKAVGIQYLTKREQKESSTKWNNTSFVIPNGFHKVLNKKMNFSNNELRAVFIGRLDFYQKGLDNLLEACRLGKDYLEHNGFRLDIYGPRRYDWKKLVQVISRTEIGKIVFLHGEISGSVKEKVLLSSDLFILPSRFEGHPMGLIEALNYGLPSLVTPGTNMSEEIQEYDCGWVCEENPQSILEALIMVIENKSQLPSKSVNAIALGNRYDWIQLAKQFHSTVKSLLSKESCTGLSTY